MRGLTLCSVLVVVGSMVGCSEAATSGGGGAGASSQGGEASNGGSGAGSAADGGGGGSVSDGGSSSSQMGTGSVVVNEIDANNDWIELYNKGTASSDLSGVLLADSDGAGGPKVDEAISFPQGTTIAAGASLFILAKQDTVSPGEQEPQTMCAPGTSPCFFAPFGLSDADGDAIYLLDGDTVLSSGEYPPAAAADGESWCRLPDGTGDFAVCAPTPGADNAAP